jgi:SAM domain (Sterile alpha motif)
MSEVRKWLEGIGLGQLAEAFEANDIDMDLKQLDDQAQGHAVICDGLLNQLEASSGVHPPLPCWLNPPERHV